MLEDKAITGAFETGGIVSYQRAECAVFRKTTERWGEYSNMAAGFPVTVNGVRILTAEALYQSCRFPHLPELQEVIIAQTSPMAAKMKGKPHRKNSRPDFDGLRVPIMWWTLRVKLACNFHRFSEVLLASCEQIVAEDSHKDAFWGAVPSKQDHGILVGQNVLGRLLTLLRRLVRDESPDSLTVVDPLDVPDFNLLREPIRTVNQANNAGLPR